MLVKVLTKVKVKLIDQVKGLVQNSKAPSGIIVY